MQSAPEASARSSSCAQQHTQHVSPTPKHHEHGACGTDSELTAKKTRGNPKGYVRSSREGLASATPSQQLSLPMLTGGSKSQLACPTLQYKDYAAIHFFRPTGLKDRPHAGTDTKLTTITHFKLLPDLPSAQLETHPMDVDSGPLQQV